MRIISVVTVLIFVCALNALAQPVKTITAAAKPEDAGMSTPRLARIDKLIEEFIQAQKVPGAVALIVRNGKVTYHKAIGVSDLSKKAPLKKDDIFRIASMSKAIANLAAMMLWEEGKFLLDDPVSKYISEFKSPTVLKTFNPKDSSFTTEPAKGEITIRQLLTHTSGLDYAVIGSPEFKAIYAKAGIPVGVGDVTNTLADKIRKLGTLPLKHNPGEKWTYGLNNDVIGYLVEIWSGMTFDQFLRTRIFDPLGMKDTYFYLPKEKHSRLVALHDFADGKLFPAVSNALGNHDPGYPLATNGKYFSGGAGLSSTVEDYAKFLQLFLNKGEYNGAKLLSRKTVELIMTDQVSDNVSPNNEIGLCFGLETQATDHRSPLSVGSFSWGGAFNTHYWADPQENLIGLIFTNVVNSPSWDIGDRFKVLTYQAVND